MNNIINLTRPIISPDHINERISCIRAHRERIFRLDTEIQHSKLICHNYGHGGAGWTFLFGCVQKSIQLFEQQLNDHPSYKNRSISIIGAGCYGLLTAIVLAQKGYTVRIIAKETAHITSYKAAGFFFPRARKCSTLQERMIFQTIGMQSYKEYSAIANGDHSFIAQGAKAIPAYYGLDIDPGFGPYIENKLIQQPELVTISFGNDKQYKVMQYDTLFIDSVAMMNELHRNRSELSIPITNAEIQSLADIDEDIVFNCAGLGAKSLTNDSRIIPVQGHLITLKNQPSAAQLHYLINVKVTSTNLKGMPRDELIYFAPKNEGILGITFLRGQVDEKANSHEFERLLQRSIEFFGMNPTHGLKARVFWG